MLFLVHVEFQVDIHFFVWTPSLSNDAQRSDVRCCKCFRVAFNLEYVLTLLANYVVQQSAFNCAWFASK